MIYVTCLLIALWAVFRGVDEGIDMHQPTNRVHWWYRHYHMITNLRDIFAFTVGAAAILAMRDILTLSGLFIILSTFPLAWQIVESSYAYTRYGNIVPDYENLMGRGIYVKDVDVLVLHIARLTAFSMLFGIGLHLALR
jgi:hypothetical protein